MTASRTNMNSTKLIIFVVLFWVIGVSLLFVTHAAAPTAGIEAENGLASGGSSILSDTSASNGAAVRFGVANTGSLWGPGPITDQIPSNPKIDNSSGSIISSYFSANKIYANAYAYGHVYSYSSASDPTYTITPSNTGSWGPNPFAQVVTTASGSASCNPLHIPNSATVPTGSDGWLHIIDSTKPGIICSLWQATKASGSWSSSWGGVWDYVHGDGITPLAGNGGGSNIEGGIILASEVAKGVIPHALGFAFHCNNVSTFRPPAIKTDGNCGTSPVQEGMRFQLDPTFNCGTMPTTMEHMICVALQQYGAYDTDTTGSSDVGFTFQTDDLADPGRAPWQKPGDYTRSGGLYNQAGITADYQSMPDIPVSRLRVLASWNGQ